MHAAFVIVRQNQSLRRGMSIENDLPLPMCYLTLIRNKLGGWVVSDPVIEGLGCGVGGEAQDLAARDSSKACCAIDNEEAQGLHAGDSVAISSLARARLGSSQSRMQ